MKDPVRCRYGFTTTYKNNAKTCLNSKLRARLLRLIVLRTIKLARSHSFYTGRYLQTKKMRKPILLLFLAFINFSCSSEIDLDDLENKKLSFAELPTELKTIYSNEFEEANDTISYRVLSLDKNYDMEHYHIGLHNQLLTKGFNHHFIINNKDFKLSANQGDPFVLYDKKLYYTLELNLAAYNYEKADYIEIDLSNYLND